MRLQELIKYGKDQLKNNKIDDETVKAKALLKYILNVDDAYLIIHNNEIQSTEIEKKYKDLMEELIEGKPLQYIMHTQEFMNLNFYVDENVLIPQPDTETLVLQAIKRIKQYENNNIKVLDLCTGSGAIAISLAKEFENKNVQVYASDISSKALEVAKKNAMQNNVQINFINSNMFENIDEKFDIIVSNPPYIETETIKKLSKDVQQEPHIALDGGFDGLEFYKIIASEYEKYLNDNGTLLLEIGYNQKQSVIELFINRNVECIKDLAQNDRVIIVK